jgi:hypothetical protein
VHCSVKYIVAGVYVRLHILISSLPMFKRPSRGCSINSLVIYSFINWFILFLQIFIIS